MNAPEVVRVNEYDPLGKAVSELSNGRIHERWHLLEALENMRDDQADFICKLAKRHGDGPVMMKAMCWESLMEIVRGYWADVEQRIEGHE